MQGWGAAAAHPTPVPPGPRKGAFVAGPGVPRGTPAPRRGGASPLAGANAAFPAGERGSRAGQSAEPAAALGRRARLSGGEIGRAHV